MIPHVVWVAAGGALGAAARYGVNVWSGRLLGSLDFAMLFERKSHLAAGAYAAASMLLPVAAMFLGLHLARSLLQ